VGSVGGDFLDSASFPRIFEDESELLEPGPYDEPTLGTTTAVNQQNA
jgi:hypothetical protein